MSDNTAFDLHYGSNNTDESRVIEWLNSAVLSTNSSEKASLLHKVQEFVLNRSPHLLMRVLPNILEYTSDRVTEVKKWLVGFIEEACKKNELVFEKVLTNLHMLLCDESIQVQKRVIQAATSVYRNMLHWLAKAPQITDGMEQAWNRFSSIKLEILNMVDSDNDGIRTHSIKFLEGVVLLQSYTDSNLPRKENDFSLDDIPLTLKFARRRKLEEEANHIFFLLVKFHGSPHISSVNLMACMGALCTIAKARPQFMQHTVTALENLNSNLPPSLTQSQVNSVKKHMKLQLINILKHPSSYDVQSQVTSILSDLGMASHELARIMPKNDDRRSRSSKRNTEQIAPPPVVSKRPRIEPPPEIPFESSIDMEVDEDEVDKQKQESNKLNVQFILEKLNPQSATQIVMESMNKLPETAPANFLENYRPFSNSGSLAHLALIAKLLAEQFTDTRVGPGKSVVSKEPPMKLKVHPSIEEAIVKGPSSKKEPEIPVPPILEEPFDPAKIKIKEEKEDKIPKVVKPKIKTLKYEFREQLLVKSVQRVLHAEHAANQGGASMIRNKIITTLATTFGSLVRDTILFFILQDLKTHIDLALSWLYQEYSYMQGFNRINSLIRKEQKPDQDYNSVLCALVSSIELIPCDQDSLLVKIFQEAPMITEEALEIFKRLSVQENRAGTCMNLLKDLVIRRPPKHMIFMNILLQRSIHEVSIVREEAIIKVLQLYEYEHLKDVIEEHAIMYLGFLTQTQPPPILFGEEHGRLQILDNWSDESAKACLYLYLALLPAKPSLIQELSRIYIQTTADVKRTIIRLLEVPIRTMGMDSSELLTLVEQCPKGAETLVTRVIHILTEKETPSVTLVAKVRELYQTRVPDVRFLIPVLIGLTKKEIIAALPKLIKLNPVVVKEVFNRLLNTESPITPADLLIALHTIDASKADLKTVMKATSLCFSEKSVFTQEVLAVVMQQLMDVTPLPTLLMRTVIQSLSLYPRLSGFIMNILQRLILKQVWKQKVVWEGFIKCCQRTKPQSFQVLLQLPTVQLAEVFETCPELRLPLLEHVQAFNETQRAHIPVSIMDVLMGRSDTLIKMEDDNIKPDITDISNVINEPLPPGMD